MTWPKAKPELKIVVSNDPPEPPPPEPAPEQVEMPFAMVNGEPLTQLPRDLYIPPQALEVFLEAFEGPLDLLLYLIRKQNLDILDIPLAEITRQYMTYIELMEGLQFELAGEYMVMAATLAEIKSRMLLPRPKVDADGIEEDPRAELVRRLQEYERFKRAAENIDALPRLERDVFATSAELKDRQVVRVLPQISLQEMLLAFKDVVVRSEMFAHHHIQRERSVSARADGRHSDFSGAGEFRRIHPPVPLQRRADGGHGYLHGDARAGARGSDRDRAGGAVCSVACARFGTGPHTACCFRQRRRGHRAGARGHAGGDRHHGCLLWTRISSTILTLRTTSLTWNRKMSYRLRLMRPAHERVLHPQCPRSRPAGRGQAAAVAELGQLFDENTRPKVDDIRATLEALAAEYSNRGLEVKETAAGFRIQVRREFASEISRLWPERPARYSRALLETLALIAYRQPITRAEIEAVRGVAVNPNIVKTVIERNWVRVVGHRDVPGRPELLGTTREFLDYFGLRSLDELPPLAELKAMGDYNLQLELPNAGALGVEKVDGDVEVEGTDGVAVAVAGLLSSEVVVEGESADANGARDETSPDVASAAADGASGDAAHDSVVDAAGVQDEGSHGATAQADGDASDSARDAVADAAGVHGEGTHDAAVQANVDAGNVAHDAVADASGMHGEGTHDAAVQANVDASNSAHDAVADASGMHGEGTHDPAAQADGDASDNAHDAVADAVGVHDEGAHDAAAQADGDASDNVRDAAADAVAVHDVVPAAAGGAHDDTEADRTLTSGNVSKHTAASDEADTSDSAISSESLDALDDATDDDSDEDELSADGHGSRELVAAPRDIDD